MDSLDFSALTDDQLVLLVRSALQECVSRNPAIAAAAQAAVLDEAEKARIVTAAAQAEAARLRAAERERLAKEAAEKVRQERVAEITAAARKAAAEAGRKAAEAARQKDEEAKTWLRRAGDLVEHDPSKITLCWLKTDYGCRVLINEGASTRYSREHLVDWNRDSGKISTARKLIGRKSELIAFCAEFATAANGKVSILEAANYSWEEPCHTN